jgi:predicted ATPase
MVFEDAHWIDPTSRKLLDLIVERVSRLPVLLIVTFRPEFRPGWDGQPHVTMLALNRLGVLEVTALVTALARNAPLGSEVVSEIVERTDGVPLFVEELTKAVLERADRDQGVAAILSATPMPALAVPPTLHASLIARLDRLGGPAKQVAQVGAVIGREFTYELIAPVAQRSEPELGAALALLTEAGLLFCRGVPPQSSYSFKHALVQDAAYGTLLRSWRQQLHARIAATLEDRFPEIVAAQPELLARHCAEGGRAEQAVVYWLKAGRLTAARSAMAEAVAQLRKGLHTLAGLPDDPWRRQQELDLQIALGPALAGTKGFAADDVRETIARARALAEQLDRPDYLVPLMDGLWAFHFTRAEHKLALGVGEQIENTGKAQNDLAVQLLGRRSQGWTHSFLGEFIAARGLLEQCHGLSDPAHRTFGAGLTFDPYASMLANLAMTLVYLGYIDQARSRMEEGLSEARRLRHAPTLAYVLLWANWMEWTTCSPELQRRAKELLALSTEHGFPYWLGLATAFRGRSLAARGQLRKGLTLLTQALAALRATGAVARTPTLLMSLAEAHAMLGQPGEGLNCLAEASQIIEATDERLDEVELHRLYGDLLNATGDRSAAERSYRQALGVAERQSAKLFELRAATRLARLWRDQGRRTEARELLAPIYNWFTEGFDTRDLREAKTVLDELT